MKNLLFLSNGTKPTKEQYEYQGEERLTNFSIPSVYAAEKMGYKLTIGVNRKYAEKLSCKYPVDFYNAEIYRNPFNIKEVFKAYKNACCELAKKDYKAIHCNTPIGGLIGRVCGKKMHINKVIYTAHGFHFYKGAPLVNRIVYKGIESFLARWTDAIITMNQEDYEAAQKFRLKKGGKVYKVHGVGISISENRLTSVEKQYIREKLGFSEEDILCISAGDLVKRKNYKTAIKAVALLNNPHIHLLICGVGREQNNLEELSRKLLVHKQIHFLGYRTDVEQLMLASDIFLLTSIQEGLPRSLMEAMSCNMPCIVSRIRGNIDLINQGEGGIVCEGKDEKKVAKAIAILAENKKLRTEMGINNGKIIKNYSVDIVKDEIEKIYEEILKDAN